MADIFLYGPESNNYDIRLDENGIVRSTGGVVITSTATASSEGYASLFLVEKFLLAIASVTETKAGAVFAESFSLAVTAKGETYAASALVESLSLAIQSVTETFSASVLAETFSVTIQAVTETYAALVLAEAVNVDAVVTAGTETGSDSVAGVLNPQGPVRTAAGGPTGTKHRKRFIHPDPEPEFAEAAFTPSTPWTPESDVPDDELLEVFAMMVNEDLF